jgi:hypothetical protein
MLNSASNIFDLLSRGSQYNAEMKFAPLFLLLIVCAVTNAATREELQIQPTGPLQVSPWRPADVPSASYNHYTYSCPPSFYYCGYGGYGCYGFYGCYGGGCYGYGYSNAYLLRGIPVITDYPR